MSGYPHPNKPVPIYNAPNTYVSTPPPGYDPLMQSGYPQPNVYPNPLASPPAPDYGFQASPQQGGYGPPPQGGYGPPPQGNYGPGGYAPVSQQPQRFGAGAGPPMVNQGGQWMNVPAGIPNCPPGLEYLTAVDQLLIKQKVELLEAFTGFETNNKYAIRNSLGQNVYYAVEDNDCCTRNCCGSLRPFDMKIFDNGRNEVIHIYRKLACQGCCFPCCLQELEVSSPPGNVIGTVEEEWTMCKPNYSLKNNHGDVVLRIEGPLCTISCCGDVEFDVLTPAGEKIGKISKQWRGLTKELLTDADSFGINFPLDLDVKMKAILLGATFLIDLMFFEDNN